MLISPDYRVALLDPNSVASIPQLEAVFVGAAPASAAPELATAALDAATRLGFAPPADGTLNGVPLAFAAPAAFAAAFPGDDSWLARAVQSYLNAGGRRAWVVRVDSRPGSALDAILPAGVSVGVLPKPTVAPLSGIEIAMQVPTAGLVLLPDLEALCLATALPPPAVPSPPPVPPAFMPSADRVPPSTAGTSLSPTPPTALNPFEVLRRVSAALSARRHDMLCLFGLPIGADRTQSMKALVERAQAYIGGDSGEANLPQVQVFVPLVRDPAGEIASPSGLIAGALADLAESAGVWRSIAGRVLPLGRTPLRRIESNALDKLRQSGVCVIRSAPGGAVLDDDILACADTLTNSARRPAGSRRLMGSLLRSLQSFGEQLVFENVLNDGRVELILTDLFARLFARGALVGQQVTDAAVITRTESADGGISFDIQVAIANAVERIRLRFDDGELVTTLGAAA